MAQFNSRGVRNIGFLSFFFPSVYSFASLPLISKERQGLIEDLGIPGTSIRTVSTNDDGDF